MPNWPIKQQISNDLKAIIVTANVVNDNFEKLPDTSWSLIDIETSLTKAYDHVYRALADLSFALSDLENQTKEEPT